MILRLRRNPPGLLLIVFLLTADSCVAWVGPFVASFSYRQRHHDRTSIDQKGPLRQGAAGCSRCHKYLRLWSSQPQLQELSSLTPATTLATNATVAMSISPPNPAPPLLPKQNHQFHVDMRRVLETRRGGLSRQLQLSQQRHHKPPLLSSDKADLDGAERVLCMLKHLVSIDAADETSYKIVMEAFCRRHRIRWHGGVAVSSSSDSSNATTLNTRVLRRAADQVQELLEELLRMVPANEIGLETYNVALQAYANCATPRGDVNYAQRADALLTTLRHLFDNNQLVESKLLVLHACAREQANLQGGSKCVDRAQALLEDLQNETKDTAILLQAHHLVLEAWSKCGSEDSVAHAEACLAAMKKLYHAERVGSHVGIAAADTTKWFNADIYSNVILAWSKSHQAGAAERCKELLQEMLEYYQGGAFPSDSEPSLIAFNGAILAYCRSGRPDLAEGILWLIETTSRNCSRLVPDVVSYNTILNTYLRKTPNMTKGVVLQRIRKLVQYMEDNRYEQPQIRPNSFTYKTLLSTWLQSSGESNLLVEAESLLFLIVRLWKAGDTSTEPSNRLFNKVINAYAKSRDPQAANKAVDLLQQMKASEAYRPDIITYTSVLECLSNARQPTAAAKAEELLQDCFDLYESSGNDAAHRPNIRTFTMAIATLAKNQGSVQRAHELLQQLLLLYDSTRDPNLQPNAYPYNYVLNCAAYTLQSNKTHAFQIAAKAYQGLRDSDLVEPDCFTYAFWLSCCSNLLARGSDLQTKCVSYAVEECKSKGLVTNEVVKRLCQGNRPELVAKLLELPVSSSSAVIASSARYPKQRHRGTVISSSSHIRIENLPPAWSRNVPTKRL